MILEPGKVQKIEKLGELVLDDGHVLDAETIQLTAQIVVEEITLTSKQFIGKNKETIKKDLDIFLDNEVGAGLEDEIFDLLLEQEILIFGDNDD